jgi:hypothetical protein
MLDAQHSIKKLILLKNKNPALMIDLRRGYGILFNENDSTI